MGDLVRRKRNPKSVASNRHPSSDRRQGLVTGLICVLLVTLVWIVFGQTLGNDFVNYDDDDYIHRNPHVTNGLSLGGINWAFTHVHSDNWHPLTTISHMLDCQLYGLDPRGHHLTNVLLHSAAVVLLFLALVRLTGARWPSAFVAAVFAIHPLHVESVAWVAERKDVLSGVFFALILWTYVGYVRESRFTSLRYILMITLYALGLMCKPTLVTLPFLLLLLDYWPLQRLGSWSGFTVSPSARKPVANRNREDVTKAGRAPVRSIQAILSEKIPFFVLSAASCVATLLAQQRAVAAMRQVTFGGRVGNAIVSYAAYLGQSIWPFHLSVIYPYRPGYPGAAQIVLAFIVLGLVSALVAIWRRRFPFLLVGWLWFLGVLVPMIGIIQVGSQVRADRYTYLSQIGLCLLITWGAVELSRKWRGGRETLAVIGLLIITALTAGSYVQTSTWRSSETMWHQALTSTSDNYIAENNLGNALMKKGQPEEATIHFRKALEINPDYSEAKYHLAFAQGYILASKGEKTDAIISFQEAIRVEPDHPNAHHNLAVILAGVGRTDEAIEQFQEALHLDPDYHEAHCNLATVLAQLGRRDEAIAHFRDALRIKPDDAKVRAQLSELEAGR